MYEWWRYKIYIKFPCINFYSKTTQGGFYVSSERRQAIQRELSESTTTDTNDPTSLFTEAAVYDLADMRIRWENVSVIDTS